MRPLIISRANSLEDDMQYNSDRGMTMMSKLQNEVNSTLGNSQKGIAGIRYKLENTLAFP